MNGSAITRYSNSIQALVYAGAAFLVVIVGLRGLGDLSHAGFIPSFLLDEGSGRIAANVVIAGLIAEFVMLLAMAAVFFHAPKTTPVHGTAVVSIDPAASGIHAAALIESERKLLDSIGRKMETLIDS